MKPSRRLQPLLPGLTGAAMITFALTAQAEVIPAEIGGHWYAIPGAMIEAGARRDEIIRQALDIDVRWPGPTAVTPGSKRGYDDGLVSILVQDISDHTRVENLNRLRRPRDRFLALWRDSTVDQSGLPDDFSLAQLAPDHTTEGDRIGMLEMRPLAGGKLPRGHHLYVDSPPPASSILMTCAPDVACQLWWMQDNAAVEVTFAGRFLPEWAKLRAFTADLLQSLRVD